MLVWVVAVVVSAIAIVVSGQDVYQPNRSTKLSLDKEKVIPNERTTDNPFQQKLPPMGAGTYHYYDSKGILHIANYVNDMYGFRILSEYTPFAPLSTALNVGKAKKPAKTKPRNKFNIETFDLFDEEQSPEPKKQNSKVTKENATSEVNQTEDQQPEPSTISETVEEQKIIPGRMPSGTFKWPSYPSVMDMGGPKAEDSKYFYGPRIFHYENRPLFRMFQTPTNENRPQPPAFQTSANETSGVASTPEPPKEATTIPSTSTTSTAKAEEPPAQVAPTVSSNEPFAGYFAINHSPAWVGGSPYPGLSSTGYSIRYGTRNVQPFTPQLRSLGKLWPEYPPLGTTMTFRTAGTQLWRPA